MILTLDVGNSQIFGGAFENGELTIRFRKPSRQPTSSDELGLFLRGVLRENGSDPSSVRQIAFCSVVPETRSKWVPTASRTRSRPRTCIPTAT